MKNHESSHSKPYVQLIMMVLLSFVAMYVLMYAMVDRMSNVIPNFNQFYMAALMAAPMILIELVVMKSMYPNRNLNLLFAAIGVVALVGFYTCIRQQTAISDKQFLKSMIPHHAGAILMSNAAELEDPEIIKLAQDIIASQQAEIELMKAKLEELENK